MKLTPNTHLLLMAALWLNLAQSNVTCALLTTGSMRAQYLMHAREDATRFRSYAAMWWNTTAA